MELLHRSSIRLITPGTYSALIPKSQCRRTGYKSFIRQFKKADHQVITHSRAVMSGLHTLAESKALVVVQDKVEDLLFPSKSVSWTKLERVSNLLAEVYQRGQLGEYSQEITNYAHWLLFHFSSFHSIKVKNQLLEIPPISPHSAVFPPHEWDVVLADLLKSSGNRISGDALRGLMGFAAGTTNAYFRPYKPKGRWSTSMNVVFTKLILLPSGVPTLLEDHTADSAIIKRFHSPHFSDMTSRTSPEVIQRIIQVSRDIQKGTPEKTVLDYLRGVLIVRPEAQRVGVICHNNHKSAIQSVETMFLNRIVMVDHFGSGTGRGSNEWQKECDLLIILGTPRISEAEVQQVLLSQHNLGAASRPGGFGRKIAVGETEQGVTKLFWTLDYRDPEWRNANRHKVVAELHQAVGRARAVRPEGIPETIVFSNEVLEMPLCDEIVKPITKSQAECYFALDSLADLKKNAQSPNSHRGGILPPARRGSSQFENQ